MRHLIKVDLPAPFGPMQATREDNETWTVAFSMVTLSLRGYLKDTSTTLMRALPFDFTPVSRTCHKTPPAAASTASTRQTTCRRDSSKFKFIFHAESAPSIGPGFGKWNLSLFDFSSK